VRGKPRSQPLPGVLAEAARLVEAGFGELVLTGIHLGLYGRDLAEPVALADAVRGVARTPGLGRLRISSVEATEVDAALLEAMGHPAVCAHLHLPLQSGDAAVLRRMNRRYTPEQFEAAVARARRELDRPAVTTDVIVGFPGETEPEFENTLAFCRRLRFSRMHVFPFSPRAGTPAAVLPNHVPPAVTRQRVGRLAELAEEMAAEWAGGFVDRRVRVLFERRDSAGLLRAYTDRYVPLTAPGPRRHVGRVAEVFCERNEGNELVGRVT